mgnify:FL=1
MHGAGTNKRLTEPPKDGRLRKDPREAAIVANIKHARYIKHTKARLSTALADFAAAPSAELFDIKVIAARLWTALLALDEVEAAFDVTQLAGMGESPTLCECGTFFRRADIAADFLNRLGAIRGVLHELTEVAKVHHKIDEQRREMFSETQVVGFIVMIVSRLREIAATPDVPREQIARRLTEWIEASGKTNAHS